MNDKEQDVIEAAGGIVWRVDDYRRRLALIHRPQYDDWSLPKGKRHVGESFSEAAIREVKEEIYCQVRLGDFAGCICYQVDEIPKVVLFWHMELKKESAFQPNREADQVIWLTRAEAIEKLKYESERQLLLNE